MHVQDSSWRETNEGPSVETPSANADSGDFGVDHRDHGFVEVPGTARQARNESPGFKSEFDIVDGVS